MNPQISIVVPVYKVEEDFLRNCIERILEQTYSDIELILVDDGSPDQCGEICDEYALTDKRIRVIHQIKVFHWLEILALKTLVVIGFYLSMQMIGWKKTHVKFWLLQHRNIKTAI